MSARGHARSALRTQLLTNTDLPVAALRQWEGTRLDPAADDLYIREALILGQSSAEDEGGLIETSGIYQLDVVGPVRGGTKPIDDLAESLCASFPIHSRFADASGFQVEIAGTQTGPILPTDAGRQYVPVSIAFRAYHLNPAAVLQ